MGRKWSPRKQYGQRTIFSGMKHLYRLTRLQFGAAMIQDRILPYAAFFCPFSFAHLAR